MSTWQILHGDVRDGLRTLPDASVQTCVTSPPYWRLRDYGVVGQLGLEATPDAYVSALVDVFREVRRVLKDDGTLWLNLGDSYASQGGAHGGRDDNQTGVGAKRLHREGVGDQMARTAPNGIKPKDLIGIPWLVAFALRADGWYLRSDIIWAKPNPMPESVTDRPTKAHEYLFLLTKSPRYYYDWKAITEPVSGTAHGRGSGVNPKAALNAPGAKQNASFSAATAGLVDERNKRSVWTVATQPYPEAHFATFPEALIAPCIFAGSRAGDTVLDPFVGSGTTGAVSVRAGRHFVGCELSAEYVALARRRIGDAAPMFAQEVESQPEQQP